MARKERQSAVLGAGNFTHILREKQNTHIHVMEARNFDRDEFIHCKIFLHIGSHLKNLVDD